MTEAVFAICVGVAAGGIVIPFLSIAGLARYGWDWVFAVSLILWCLAVAGAITTGMELFA